MKALWSSGSSQFPNKRFKHPRHFFVSAFEVQPRRTPMSEETVKNLQETPQTVLASIDIMESLQTQPSENR